MAEAVKKFERNNEQVWRSAPQNVEAEQALLGAILVNNDAYYRVSDFLRAEHFFEPIHKQIYKVATDMIRAAKRANPVTIKTFLPAEEKLGDVTVGHYLARLAAEATTIINAEDYGRSVYDLFIRRQLITIGEDMVNIAYDAPVEMPPGSQIEDAERRLFELAETGQYDGGFHDFASALNTAIDIASEAYKRDGGLSGVSTGIHALDMRMGGLQKSDLIVLAGRPGMGKTSLATNIAFNIAHNYLPGTEADGTPKALDGGVVGFFSLEMSAEQLATRIISEQAEISSSKIRRGEITEPEFEMLAACAQEMARIPLYIDETGGISIAQLAARARRLKRQRGLDEVEQCQPRAGGDGDHHRPEGAGEGAANPDHRAVAAVAPGGKPRRQAAAALGLARIGIDRAGRRRGSVRLSRGILPAVEAARRGRSEICRMA
jgi:replicative DNA helicase